MYEIWAYKQDEKRKDERKPFSKMEYDCTENYFDWMRNREHINMTGTPRPKMVGQSLDQMPGELFSHTVGFGSPDVSTLGLFYLT